MFLIVVVNLSYDNNPAETAMENYFLSPTLYIVSITIWGKSWI